MNEADRQNPETDSTLAEAIQTAERIAGPAFQRADGGAKTYQKRFRAAELTVIFGSVVAVGLALGASLANQMNWELAALPAKDVFSFSALLLTGALGSLAFISRGLRFQRRWLRRRWAAETLRGERFLFIGRFGDYADAAEPDRLLRQRLVAIERMVRGEAAADG